MKIEQPGLYLRIDPLRITVASKIGNEMIVTDIALSPDNAASLGTQLLTLSALERQAKSQEAIDARDAEFLRSMKVVPQ